MDRRKAAVSWAGHLTRVREGSDVLSGCSLPPIGPTRSAREPGGGAAGRQEVSKRQQEPGGRRSLLGELGRIEADLREGLRLGAERRREKELQRTQLCHLSLGQRVSRPWVSSYFRRFPMHIYCLPVQAANQRARRCGCGQARRK